MSEIRRGVRRLLRLDDRGTRSAVSDADDELRAIIEARIDDLVARGMSREQARAEAEARLGGSVDEVRQLLRRSARHRERRATLRERMSDLWCDFRYGARALRREPLVTGFIVATLALGIGANAAMYGVGDRLLLRGPTHVREPERVVRLYATARARAGNLETNASFGYVTYAILARAGRSLESVGAYQVRETTLGRGIGAEKIVMGRATASLFPTLGVRAARGRFFTDAEDAPYGARHVAVIGYDLWQRLFNGDDRALGAKLLIGEDQFTVVGVAPRGFTGAGLARVDAWTPLSLLGDDIGPGWDRTWSWSSIRIVGRIGATATATEAGDIATSLLLAAYTGRDPMVRNARLSFRPLSYTESGEGQGREPAELSIVRWLVGVSLIVLLIACANVANLQLARGIMRHRESAVRVALGAGRSRLVRMHFVEGLLLASGGGVVSLAVAYALGRLLRGVLLANVEWDSTVVDLRVFGATAGIALAVAVLVGLLPALRATDPDLASALRATRRAGGGRQSRLRAGLTLVQSALSVVLLIGAGLFIRSVRNIDALDFGVAADSVVAAQLAFPAKAPSESREAWEARRKAFYANVLDRARAIPGVEHATLAVGVPFASYYGVSIWIPGRDSLPAFREGSPRIRSVAGDYFQTVGTRILRGRAFNLADQEGGEAVAIVSERLARAFWPGEDAIGKCFIMYRKDLPCARVVGIAANTYSREIGEEPGLQYYVPFNQVPFGGVAHLLVRPSGDAASFVGPIRRTLLGVDSTLGYLEIKTLRQGIEPQLRPWRLGTTVFGLFGVLAALVAAAGLYSVVAYLVTTRMHEIGVRVALGATVGSVVTLVVRNAIAMAASGAALGAIAALAVGPFIEPLLFRTSAADPVVFVAVSALLLCVALAASLVPALRAGRISAAEALRVD